MDAEKSFFQQKTKCELLIEGDKCSKFFHNLMKKKTASNGIPFFVTDQGNLTQSLEDIVKEFIHYFTQLFGCTVPIQQLDWSVFFEGPCLATMDATHLTKEVEIQEVREALYSIGNNKSPGPNGYTAAFFKEIWNIAGQTLFEAVSEFFRSGKLLKQFNHVIVVLIPKVKDNPGVKDFRPIACSNVVYKIIAKILSNRTSSVLPGLINHSQAAFVKGRNMVDNIQLAQHNVRDDIMMFSRGDHNSVQVLVDDLKHFSVVSGLHVNAQKSNLVNFPQGRLPVKYLGLPLTSQRATNTNFVPLVDIVDANIRRWNTKTLSLAGRSELIRIVIQGIEGFWLQAFPIHKSVLNRIIFLCRSFLWGNKVYKVAWDDICKPKDEGGLGIRNSFVWNQALLTKNLWNIASNKETLWVQWVHAVYLQGGSVWTWIPKKGDSHLFKKLAKVRDKFLHNIGDAYDDMEETMSNLWEEDGGNTAKLYDILRVHGVKQPWMKIIWQSYIPPRYTVTAWMALRKRLPTKVNLSFVDMDRKCSL
ncbi:unnamed protein product [Cuscuta campestris]|uniref:Reverse transcriptase zinc-binding domain-containing protein n=1 Tax=Cuscuta campestris TaxID=132261 RepID=A0A484M1Y5_9ASTE|nr:unnamed protein product [Cuscuta campestris]